MARYAHSNGHAHTYGHGYSDVWNVWSSANIHKTSHDPHISVVPHVGFWYLRITLSGEMWWNLQQSKAKHALKSLNSMVGNGPSWSHPWAAIVFSKGNSDGTHTNGPHTHGLDLSAVESCEITTWVKSVATICKGFISIPRDPITERQRMFGMYILISETHCILGFMKQFSEGEAGFLGNDTCCCTTCGTSWRNQHLRAVIPRVCTLLWAWLHPWVWPHQWAHVHLMVECAHQVWHGKTLDFLAYVHPNLKKHVESSYEKYDFCYLNIELDTRKD